LRAKNTAEGKPYIEGYLAVFDNVDQGGDRIIKGAFAKSIKERVRAGKVPLMVKHFAYGGDVTDAIGLITEAREDDYGLWIHADLSSVQLAKDTHTKITEGIVWGMSVGFQLLRYEEVREGDDWILELKECRLVEGTVTVRPMNEEAVIHRAKSLRAQLAATTSESEPDTVALDGIQALCKSVEDLVQSLEGRRTPPPPEPASTENTEPETDSGDADLELAGKTLYECELYMAGLVVETAQRNHR